MATIDPLQFYKYSTNGQTYYEALPSNQVVSGHTLVSDLSDVNNEISKYSAKTDEWSQNYVQSLQQGLQQIQSGTSPYTLNNGVISTPQADQSQQQVQTELASGNYTNLGTATAPLMVPKGSAGELLQSNPAGYAATYGGTGVAGYNPPGTYQNIPNPTMNIPQTGTPTPSLPTPNATNSISAYYTSLSQSVSTAQTNLDIARKQQIDQINADKAAAQSNFDTATSSENKAIQAEQKAKLDALDLETKRFNDNYTTVQGLIGQLTDLMTKGNALVEQQKGVTGLAAIRNPRIDQTINSITASVGVIRAAIDGYNGQMSAARAQLIDTTNVLTSAYKDQIDYYSSLADFYGKGIVTATAAQHQFMADTVSLLKDKVDQAQKNSDYIQSLMTSPTTALFMAQAGITLNDTPTQVNAKMAAQAKIQEVSDTTNTYVKAGWTPSATQTSSTVPVQVGGTTLYFKPPAKEVTGGSSLVNPITGQVISTAPKIPAPTTVSTTKPIVSGSLSIAKSDISGLQTYLNGTRGSDGYVYTPDYLQSLNDWTKNGGILADFLKYYPPKSYLNPNDASIPTWLKDKL